MKRALKIMLPVGLVLFCAVPAMADDLDPLYMTGNGFEAAGKGLVTTVATPLVAVDHLANGDVDDALVSVVSTPVQGVLTFAAGTVQIIGGIGGGLAQAGERVFGATAQTAKEMSDNLNDNSPLQTLTSVQKK